MMQRLATFAFVQRSLSAVRPAASHTPRAFSAPSKAAESQGSKSSPKPSQDKVAAPRAKAPDASAPEGPKYPAKTGFMTNVPRKEGMQQLFH
jgi:hypothetical protein